MPSVFVPDHVKIHAYNTEIFFANSSFCSTLEQAGSLTKQNSLSAGGNLSFSFSSNESRISSWLQSSEEMEKCSRGNDIWRRLKVANISPSFSLQWECYGSYN